MAEEQSVLVGATLDNSNLDWENTGVLALIDGGFMSVTVSTWLPANFANTNIKEFEVKLAKEMNIVSAFVQSRSSFNHNRPAYIYIGNDSLFMNKASWNLLDSGFFLMKSETQLEG